MFALAGWSPGQDFMVTPDPGAKWQRLSKLAWSTHPAFRSTDEGYLLRVDNPPGGYGGSRRKYSLWRTTDGGRHWARHANTPELTTNFILLGGQDILFLTKDGKLYASHDNGATSALERDSSSPTW
jgi:photosystem II stability/assembly factor-like uncharacterized protein